MSEQVKRKIRFPPDPNTLAYLSEDLEDREFKKAQIGLVVNESIAGCSAVFLASVPLDEERVYRMKVGHISNLKAEIRWLKNVDNDLVRVGFQYVKEK